MNEASSENTRPIFINGKFFGQRITGVQRFARETVFALDALLGHAEYARHRGRFTVLLPDVTEIQKPKLKNILIRHVGGRASHVWEQFRLPLASRGGLLVNLSGSSPIFNPGQVCTFHDAAVFDFPLAYSRAFRRWYQISFRVNARLAERILTVSAFSKERLLSNLRISPGKIRIIPNGSDHIAQIVPVDDIIQRLNLQSGRYLLAVGSSHPAKNFSRLMSAFGRLDDQGIALVVVGGNNSAVFASFSKDLAASNARNVVFAGGVSDGELVSLYSHALAFVFPSLYEGFGIPPLEAMMCGCPVAASNAASIPEVCGNAAAYFDPLNEADMVHAMHALISDRLLRSDLAERGRARAAHYTWEQAAVALLKHLNLH